MAKAPELIGIAQPNIVSFDNGGTNTRAVLTNGEQFVSEVTSYPTPATYQEAIIKLSQTVDRFSQVIGRP